MQNEIANKGLQLIWDALGNAGSDIVSWLYAGAAIVTLLAAMMVKNSLNTAKYRR